MCYHEPGVRKEWAYQRRRLTCKYLASSFAIAWTRKSHQGPRWPRTFLLAPASPARLAWLAQTQSSLKRCNLTFGRHSIVNRDNLNLAKVSSSRTTPSSFIHALFTTLRE